MIITSRRLPFSPPSLQKKGVRKGRASGALGVEASVEGPFARKEPLGGPNKTRYLQLCSIQLRSSELKQKCPFRAEHIENMSLIRLRSSRKRGTAVFQPAWKVLKNGKLANSTFAQPWRSNPHKGLWFEYGHPAQLKTRSKMAALGAAANVIIWRSTGLDRSSSGPWKSFHPHHTSCCLRVVSLRSYLPAIRTSSLILRVSRQACRGNSNGISAFQANFILGSA